MGEENCGGVVLNLFFLSCPYFYLNAVRVGFVKQFTAIAFFIVLCLSNWCNAQYAAGYNLNQDNGLPSNRVYTSLVDRLGYLWIATANGVVKFNGYECKVFGTADGLPTNDNWQLVEDSKGRIWLGNITKEIGYLYNDIYHRAYDAGRVIYPSCLRKYKDGIIFLSTMINEHPSTSVCRFVADSFTKFDICNIISKDTDRTEKSKGCTFIDDSFQIYCWYYNVLAKLVVDDTGLRVKNLAYSFDPDYANYIKKNYLGLILKHYLVFLREKPLRNKCLIFDLNTCTFKSMSFPDFDELSNLSFFIYQSNPDLLKVVTNRAELDFSVTDSIRLLTKRNYSDILGGRKLMPTAINFDPLWGRIYGTGTLGVFYSPDAQNHFRKIEGLDIANYTYIGEKPDKEAFWWNENNSTLLRLNKDFTCSKYILPSVTVLERIIPFGNDSFLLLSGGSFGTFWLTFNRYNRPVLAQTSKFGLMILSIFQSAPDQFMTISKREFYLTKHNFQQAETIIIDRERYSGLIYDQVRNSYLAYNNNKICIRKANGDKTIITGASLKKWGVSIVRKIVINSTTGSIFLCDDNNVYSYDYEKQEAKKILQNINLSQPAINLYKNVLVVSGKFGVAFCLVKGKNMLSAPMVYYNARNLNYSRVYSTQVSWNKVLLNTDKGPYAVDIPLENELSMHTTVPDSSYRFLLKYKDTTINIKDRDSIEISPYSPKLDFDVISKNGIGRVIYYYKYGGDSVWQRLVNNELYLPRAAPDKFYTISLMAEDDVWRSEVAKITYHVKAAWWQKRSGKNIIWAGALSLFVVIIGLVVYATKKIITEKNEQTRHLLELEITGIYAQANPHFISNTLNSALYYIKTGKLEEAYSHIFKFSKLLRSYLDSSRKTYIPLSEEIENLRNYVDIQRTRFPNVFDYEIILDNIKRNDIQIPSLLLQPLVENAINHGLIPKEENGYLKIFLGIDEKEKCLTCIIEDNGIGRKKSQEINSQSTVKRNSHGSQLLIDLIAILNKYKKAGIQMEYVDKPEPHTGTIVIIKIKNFING